MPFIFREGNQTLKLYGSVGIGGRESVRKWRESVRKEKKIKNRRKWIAWICGMFLRALRD